MHQTGRWGNGRNWNKAPPREGGWVRIWPMTSDEYVKEEPQPDLKEDMKHTVQQVRLNYVSILS